VIEIVGQIVGFSEVSIDVLNKTLIYLVDLIFIVVIHYAFGKRQD